MTEQIQRKLSDSKAARWTALAIVAFTMLCGYFLTDVMSPLKPMLEEELAWTSTDFGIFTSAYGWFNVFFLMLIFGGMILDKMGVRFTGMGSCILMLVGCAIKYAAVAGLIGAEGTIFGWKAQVALASLGYAIFGVGVEIAGITVSKVIVKWFKGKELALAMGLEMATARIGTMLAMAVTVPFAKYFQSVSAPVLLCLIMLCIGTISYMVYIVMDRKLEASMSAEEEEKEAHGHHHHEEGHDHHHEEHEHHHEEHEHHHEEHGHHHHHHHEGGEVEEYGIGTFVYYRRPAFDIHKFDHFIATRWSRNIIRAKGVCYFSHNRDMSYLFEQAGTQKQLTEAGLWYATAPEEDLIELMRQEPGLMRDWDEKYGDRMQKIVFIGQHMDKEQIIRDLDECLE